MDILILFTDYYLANKADALLAKSDIAYRLIPTPISLQNTCGLCILLKVEQLERTSLWSVVRTVLGLFKEEQISHSGLYEYSKKNAICRKISYKELAQFK
ncbi:DUF3343 domain-containing protein [uncultured Veillonella sp.]|uniref:DUF3343 domain-containing protein n=1 Tax=uncultured Veillonella sp. TaxID=159268 RepID=UPI00261EDE8E|nr:DUF3343 domain-containing protein [uncultured Veillonella sp.]